MSSQDTSPIPSSMSSPLSSLSTRVHQYKTRYLRIHSKSGQFLILQVNLQVIQVYKIECTRYDKVRIQDSRVKSEEQANPRLRVVHRVSNVSPTEYVWRMSQWCPNLAGPWCTEVVGHQLTHFHMHSAKLRWYMENPGQPMKHTKPIVLHFCFSKLVMQG